MSERRLDEGLVESLHRKANADRWGLTPVRFAVALEASAARSPDSRHDIERYLASLHLEDLALSAACADGHEGAWEHFVRELRPVLYRAADAIDRTGAAREVADSLYAELFGLTEREGERRSLLRYFHGRSSLATWLRAVLAQRYVDNVRRTRRLETLPADEDPGALAASPAATEPDRTRHVVLITAAITAAVGRLAPRDRLRLACYYAQDLTLAQIGRALGEHEATTSRHLARVRRTIRQDVERQLERGGMSEPEIGLCFSSVAEDAGSLDLAEIFGRERKNPVEDRST
jgi:RNA polymerase sigma-70 factor (ECF subfamily)